MWAFAIVGALTGLILATAAQGADLRSPKPSWQLGLRSTGYFTQSEDRAGTKDDHVDLYNHVSGAATGLVDGRLTFRGAGRFANDPAYAWSGFERSVLYTGLLEARLARTTRIRVGRQFVQSGVTGLTLDGAWFTVRPLRKATLDVWGGARSPYGNAFELGKLDKDAAAGGRVVFTPSRGTRLGLSAAYRERDGGVAYRPVGLEAAYAPQRRLRLFGRATYDLEGDRWSRLQAQAQWQRTPTCPSFTLQYLDRHPDVAATSWFARFADVKRIRLARASARWEHRTRFGGEAEYLGSFVDTRTSTRLGLAALVPGGRLGYSARLGDAGEESRFFGELSVKALSWMWIDGHATFSTYALLADAPAEDERDLTTLSARIRAQLRQGFRVIAEVQSVENPLFSQDVRFLLGVDLSMARGASRFGLDRGGWL